MLLRWDIILIGRHVMADSLRSENKQILNIDTLFHDMYINYHYALWM